MTTEFRDFLITFVATAAAIFFFVVRPLGAMARFSRPEEEDISEEERRHQELLAALTAR
jgi:large-conductance mechanosensitive channel